MALRENGTPYWLLTDHPSAALRAGLGSTAVTVNSSGSKVGELRYQPYGATRYTWGTTPTARRFTGQLEESTIALYDYGARFYDPALGRFVSADTIVPQAGNPQALNRFAYVLNNPLRYVDPTGHGPDPWEGEGGRELPPLPPPGGGTNWLEGLFQGLGSLLDKALGIRFMLPIPMTPGAEFRPEVSPGSAGGADFYVRQDGNAVPATMYRYMNSEASPTGDVFDTQTIVNPAGKKLYVTPARFDSAPMARNRLQISTEWSDAVVRAEFNSLQIIDDIQVPAGTRPGAPFHLEPLTTDWPEFGIGKAPQYMTTKPFILVDRIDILPNPSTTITPYAGPYLPIVLKY